MKIIAVIVTHNRLPLLKKSLEAVRNQTRKPDTTLVINNGSTDATGEWLATQPVTTLTKENNGGAGGFSYGINAAYSYGADWIWLMDDDSIPEADALQQLEKVVDKLGSHREKTGFLASTVLWTDGNLHELNKTYPLKEKRQLEDFAFANDLSLPLIKWGTFVSMLLSAKAVEKVGLPVKDFFIWSDDIEYSKRIIGSRLAGISVKDSIVVHETPTNHRSSVLKDPENAIWKYRYGLRNELITKRWHEGGWKFWISWVHRMFIMPFRILMARKNHKWPFIKVVWQSSISALFFHPAIESATPVGLAKTGQPANLDTLEAQASSPA